MKLLAVNMCCMLELAVSVLTVLLGQQERHTAFQKAYYLPWFTVF